MWKTSLQSLVAQSSTEAEYISLADSLRLTLTYVDFLLELKKILPINLPTPTVLVHEDNASCIEVANQGKYTPRTKYIAVKYQFFKQHIDSGLIKIQKISTTDQRADILTKPLQPQPFNHIRKLLLGW